MSKSKNFGAKDWIEKRRVILHRDNYSCQYCKTFNPQLGVVELIDHNSFVELHEYECSPSFSTYRISSQKNGLTIEIDFDRDWLVLPVLQIHHKKYIEGRMSWEYEDDDLVTLCKQCHTSLHLTQQIPVYDMKGNFVESRIYPPEDFGNGRNHNYKPWIFISKDKKDEEYFPVNISPRVTYVTLGLEEPSEIKELTSKMVGDFFTQFLPSYRVN